MNNSAEGILELYQKKGDAEHIATVINLRRIIDFCKETKPKRILELGGGVGAISHAMLANSDAFVDIYEDNDFCQRKLKENLQEFEGRYSIVTTYRTLPPARSYDFMVIDGGNKEPHHPEWFFIRYLESIKAIYIEGYRRSQYAWASKALAHKYIFKTIKVPGEVIDGKLYKGGTFITCKLSHNALFRLVSYLYGRVTEDLLFDRLIKFIRRVITGR